MYNGNGANINIGLQNLESFFSNVGVNIASGTQNIKSSGGHQEVKPEYLMYKGDGGPINIGLQNLDFFPNSFFSNEGGSKLTTVGDIMTKGDGTKVNIASGT